MDQIYFVDINTSADATLGFGSEASPFNYDSFMSRLALSDETTIDNIFNMKGFRHIVSSGGDPVNPISADNIWFFSKKHVTLNNWTIEPWKLFVENDFYFKSLVDWFEGTTLNGGMIQCSGADNTNGLNFRWSIDNDVEVIFNNVLFDGLIDDGSSDYTGGSLSFRGCLLNNFKIYLENYSSVGFVNTIIRNPFTDANFSFNNVVFTNYSFDNVISNRLLQGTSANNSLLNSDGVETVYDILYSNSSKDTWDDTSASTLLDSYVVSSIAADDLNYLNSSFNNFSAVSGNNTYGANDNWWDGQRDGIGALYFPSFSATFSANPVSAYYDGASNVIISAEPITSADVYSNKSYRVNMAEVSSTSANVFESDFSLPESYDIDIVITSYRGWFDETQTLVFNSYDYPLSASIVFYGVDGIQITSAGIGDYVIVSASNLGGVGGVNLSGFDKYTFGFGDSTSSTTITDSTSAISASNRYTSADSYDVLFVTSPTRITLPSVYYSSASFPVVDNALSYYVNINESYSGSPNAGTSGNPLNFDEFISRLNSGQASTSSTFYVQGYRLTDENITIPNKSLIINGWDLSTYGPWVLAIDCNGGGFANISARDFSNVTMKNGIIYTSPYSNTGCRLNVSKIYDMFIVSQGNAAEIGFDTNDVNVIGCTLRADGGFRGTSDLDAVEITDSVLTNFATDYTTEFSATTFTIRNDAFDKSQLAITTDFGITLFVGCQFSWTSSTDYPFDVDNDLYLQPISVILANKYLLKPFSGITCPPNPGYGKSDFVGYETGLFGVDRNTFSACGG